MTRFAKAAIAVLAIFLISVFLIVLLAHSTTIYSDIQFRRDTAANWTAANPVLKQGTPGYETDTGLLKIGDGLSSWRHLNYYGNLYGYTTSTLDLTTTAQTAALPAGLGFAPNMIVSIFLTTDATKYMTATVISYNRTTGSLAFTVTNKNGTGTGLSPWVVWLASGPTGPQGPPNTLAIGTITTGDPGTAAAATITGDSPNQILNMELPSGPTGPTGPAGTFTPFPSAGIIISDSISLTASLAEHDGYIPYGVGGAWTSADVLGNIKVSDITMTSEVTKTVSLSGSPYVYEVIIDAYHSGTSGYHYIRINGDTGINYAWSATSSSLINASYINLSPYPPTSGSYLQYRFIIRSANVGRSASGNTTVTSLFGTGSKFVAVDVTPNNYTLNGAYLVSTPMTSMTFGTTAGTISGNIYVNRIR